jgi:hypothetical protein
MGGGSSWAGIMLITGVSSIGVDIGGTLVTGGIGAVSFFGIEGGIIGTCFDISFIGGGMVELGFGVF